MSGFYPHRLRLAPELLDGQFLICTRRELLPAGWRSVTHGRWLIGWSAPLDCTPVRSQGQTLGWVLGHTIHPELGWMQDAAIPVDGSDKARFDDMVGRLRGRFIAIRIDGGSLRVSPDAAASLAAVYAPAEECLAATSSLIPLSPATPFDVDAIFHADIPYEDRNYPVGLTPRRGVFRLLPDHEVDTGSWQSIRCWPAGDITYDNDLDAVARAIGEGVRQALAAASRVAPLDLALTAGLDTRLVLACGREVLDGASFYTGDLMDVLSLRDVVAAREIASRFGLRHRVVPWMRPSRRELEAWVIRTGGEVGEVRGWRGCRTLAAQLPGHISISGTTGNVLSHGEIRDRHFQEGAAPEPIVRRAGLALYPAFVAQAQRWLDGIPSRDLYLLGDLLFLEQRHGCWGGVIEYGELGRTRARLCPILSIRDMRAAFQLPKFSRSKRGLHRRVIELFWPELLEIPFNKEYELKGPRVRYYRTREGLTRRLAGVQRLIRKTRSNPRVLLRRLGLRGPVAVPN